ncbi:hypothetical protein FEM48_Zijuj08G0003300 [Ziziphus jujuba var. spinosa]|uniref:Uncharacterized protein n=1 Tax=Ziziphus jujuba var. spinosa TaxID=714518 RepID=A0A978UVW5_ZIZJJ|nr:hypothetical protein FEM48_Zijuj08G0003300 [Ziziphus jujuba var. spinosa]
MLIMSTQLSPTTFRCISVLACANSWARQHFISKNKPLATMSTNFSASSLTLNQSTCNPSAAFTRQGTSNRQLKHLTRSLMTDPRNQRKEMDTLMYQNFPINLEEGSKTKARNGKIYGELQHGVKYLDIYEGDGKMGKEGDKFDIDYEVYDKAGEYIDGKSLKKFPSVNLDTGERRI